MNLKSFLDRTNFYNPFLLQKNKFKFIFFNFYKILNLKLY